MLVEEAKSIFSGWKRETLSAAGVNFSETADPVFHRSDDYKVIYEASFEPNVLDKARVELWVTDIGHVAIGIETYERILKRTGLIAFRRGFALGSEPGAVSEEALQTLFDAVSKGRAAIFVKSSLRMVSSVRLFLQASDYDSLVEAGYQPKWISSMADVASSPLMHSDKMLIYRPW